MKKKVYLLLSESDQGGVNNLHTRKKFLQHNKEQIIDSSRERGRCVVVDSYLPYGKKLRFQTENFGNDRLVQM
jgi:hypothetical protein